MTPSQGSAISPANRPNDRPLAANARRFVRFDTGSSSDPEFDRCVQAYRCGLARASSLAAVANTTGVSSTTVASRLSTAVVTAATANTRASSRCGRPAAARASHAPQARNSPSSSHSCASTSTAARKPMTGPSRLACSPASCAEIAPVAITSRAAGTATTASGKPRGRHTAQPRTTTRAATETASAAAFGCVSCPLFSLAPIVYPRQRRYLFGGHNVTTKTARLPHVLGTSPGV